MTPYRTQGEKPVEPYKMSDNELYTKVCHYAATAVIGVALTVGAVTVTDTVIENNAKTRIVELQTSPAWVEQAKAMAAQAQSEANRAMWEKMAPK
jgi:hypothetical protein